MKHSGQSTLLPSFGRRRGRKLRPSRDALVERLLPELLIYIGGNASPDFAPRNPPREVVVKNSSAYPRNFFATCNLQPATLFTTPHPLWLEIGFGGGEHLVEQAKKNSQVNFIGCEPYVNGMASLLAQIQKHNLKNIRLYDGDARILLETLPDHSLEKLFILFPDPWPKTRHHKKRIIAQASLALFHRKLKSGGLLRIATDHADYLTWMLENLLASGKFEWQARSQADWNTPPADWVVTRYQSKAMAEGRKAVFLDWIAK